MPPNQLQVVLVSEKNQNVQEIAYHPMWVYDPSVSGNKIELISQVTLDIKLGTLKVKNTSIVFKYLTFENNTFP